MLSRVAENLFWMGRYTERAENTARLLNVNSNLILDLKEIVQVGWLPLLKITAREELFFGLYEEANENNVVSFMTGDTRNPGSIFSSISAAREGARTVRDIIPREAWECVNSLHLEISKSLKRGLKKKEAFEFLRVVISGVQQLTGLLASTMSHDAAYFFLKLGRNLERADMTTRIIDVRSASLMQAPEDEISPYDNIQWASVLRSLSAYQMYRQYVRKPVNHKDVMKFLLKNGRFPRSVRHCMLECRLCLRKLPRRESPLKLLRATIDKISDVKAKQLSTSDINAMMDEYQGQIADLNNLIADTYF